MSQDRRKHLRHKTRNVAELESFDGQKRTLSRANIHDISPHGVSLKLKHSLNGLKEFKIRFSVPNKKFPIEAMVSKVWETDLSKTEKAICGLQFLSLNSIDYSHLKILARKLSENKIEPRRKVERRGAHTTASNDRRKSDRRWRLPTYPLYINGRDILTSQYEYCVHADKAISEPQKCREVIKALKSGDVPNDYSDYVYARYCIGDEKHNELAMAAASKAFQTYKSFPLSKKIKIFDDIYRLLLKHKQMLIDLLIAEGHPKKLGEWEFSGMIRAFTNETVSFYRTEVAKNLKKSKTEATLLVRKPDGVVCLSPPRNASSSNSLTGALSLLTGNTLVIKPPSTLPISTIYLWKNVIDEALRLNGAPIGTLNIVTGNTLRYLNQWMKSDLVNDIIYFGESSRGIQIGQKIYASGKKPILELSGKDILLIWKDADLEGAADSLLDCFLGSTQICMVPKMAIIHEKALEKFKTIFLQKVKMLKIGLPTDPKTCLSPVVKIPQFYSFLEDCISNGGKLLTGARRLNYKGIVDEDGNYIEPTILEIKGIKNLYNLKCVREENFFPLLPLISISSENKSGTDYKKDNHILNKMIEIVKKNEYGLRVSAWTNSDSVIRKMTREIDNCGLLRINVKHVDFSQYLATHGGPAKTGGPFGELNYFWQKTSHLQGITIRKTS